MFSFLGKNGTIKCEGYRIGPYAATSVATGLEGVYTFCTGTPLQRAILKITCATLTDAWCGMAIAPTLFLGCSRKAEAKPTYPTRQPTLRNTNHCKLSPINTIKWVCIYQHAITHRMQDIYWVAPQLRRSPVGGKHLDLKVQPTLKTVRSPTLLQHRH